MFLIGSLDPEDYQFDMMGKVIKNLTKEDLVNAKTDSMNKKIINLETLQMYDPENNKWLDFKKE